MFLETASERRGSCGAGLRRRFLRGGSASHFQDWRWNRRWSDEMTVTRAVWGYIESRDHGLMRRVHRWRAPKWIRISMMLATRCGDGWIWYLLGAILLLFGGPRRFLAVGSGAVAVAVGIRSEERRVGK